MMRCNTFELFDQVKTSFISALGSILLAEEAPVLDRIYDDNVQILKMRSILREKYESAKEAYHHEVNAYYGWFWGDSSFVNIIKVMTCFELIVGDVANLEQTLVLSQMGLDAVTTADFSRDATAKWRITKFWLLLGRAMVDFPDAPEFLVQQFTDDDGNGLYEKHLHHLYWHGFTWI